ncbi:type II secretion system protein N [Variovorax sp. Sphag1AA]|uniref:type II secretion system protein N n=1 Tax=Variovorax sp. Sphag1AA TaxID=2587027 RepID=UPI0017F9C5EC|nr:type II secretion system protein N [Variovorax sp. Sphag1AA]MBB3177257.1 general secretion pathway protein C [Variovorax sp. Sphag1AA]
MSVPYAPARWPAAATTAGIWALAAASVVFWGLRLAAPSDAIAPPAVLKAALEPDPAAVAQMLGAVSNQPVAAATPEAASRFALLGVVADADQQGAALIAVDGKPARPFKVGAKVADGFVLQSVTTRGAALGPSADGKAALTLQLPTRPLAIPSPPQPFQPSQPAVMAPPQPAFAAPPQPAVAAPQSPAGAPPAVTAPPPLPPNFPVPGVAPVMAPPAEPT